MSTTLSFLVDAASVAADPDPLSPPGGTMSDCKVLSPPTEVFGRIIVRVVDVDGFAKAEVWSGFAWEPGDRGLVAETLPGKGRVLSPEEFEEAGIPLSDAGGKPLGTYRPWRLGDPGTWRDPA